MKQFIQKIIVCLVWLPVISSCSKYLDVVPDNIATLDNAFADRYTTLKFLATCYWGTPKSAGWNENPGMLGAFEITLNKDRRNQGGMQAALGENSASLNLINYWSSKGEFIRSLYAGVRDCNTFLERVDGVKDLNQYEKERMKAEVKLLKAYYHFYLIKYYGPICPLRTNIPVNESTQGVRVYREKIDDCFKYVLDLINEAISSNALPKIIEDRATEIGRFTLPVAHFMKALVSVYWASPLFNGNTDYNGFVNQDNEPFFNQTYDAKRWDSAAAACRAAVMVCEEAGIRLYQREDYLAVSAKKMSDTTLVINTLRSAVTQKWNPEIIWGNSSYPANWGYQIAAITRFEQGTSTPSSNTGTLSVPLSTVEVFYSDKGIPINEDRTYPYATRYNTRVGDEAHNLLIAKDGVTASLNFDRELRYYATLGFDRGRWYGNSYKNYPDNDAEALYPRNRFGEFSSVFNPGEYNATGYWPKKLISMNTTWRDANSVSEETYPYPDMRFADLLLLCAEALNESKPAPDAEVFQLIDRIRARAGLKGVVESWSGFSNQPQKPATKAGMREIIQQERKIELACESSYYWDSRRWKTAIREQNRPIQGWNVYASVPEEYYTVTTIYTQKFTVRDYFAPVPLDDIIKNPLLVQNPGW
ncbi:RagB/SusD family nutrient uptake outer membrane protein [Niabella beijingensis]|uniref:RagB/SusD family nutrient uptake outer membrane protein n=1 Tax=Niabella beijingensis TaxID=2872700 RepID=UPI001CC0CD1C|nr:RagB/SusD family nutrient uptake outer membrane protein [Niabella beijingensis]MBZ4190347.1 RagB/SusD family nutrient uptake outer membrane protein [Niabella beijingensis]